MGDASTAAANGSADSVTVADGAESLDLVLHGAPHVLSIMVDTSAADGVPVLCIDLEEGAVTTRDEAVDASVTSWHADFPAPYLESITSKTGSFKRFTTFVSMLLTAMRRAAAAERGLKTVTGDASVSIELLTYADLEALRGQRNSATYEHHAPGSTPSSSSQRRYLILTYATEFDRVHYPLPLSQWARDAPNAVAVLERTVSRLRRALADMKRTAGGGVLGQHGLHLAAVAAVERARDAAQAHMSATQATTSARREAELTTELRAARDEALRWRLAASLPQSAAAANTLNGGDDAAEALRAANEHLRGRVRELTVALATAAAVGSTSHRAAAVAARATAADSRSRNSRLRGAGDGPVLPSRPTSPSWTPRAPNGTAGSVRSSSATRSVSSTQAAAPRGQGAARPRSLSAASSGAAAATVYGGGRRGTSIGPPQRVPSPAPVIRSRGRTDVRNASASGRTSAVQPRPLQHRPASESGLQARSATAASVNSTVGRNAGSATGRTTARGVSSMSSRSSWAGGSSVNSHRSDVAPAARGRGTTRQSTSATRYEPRRTTVTSSNGLSATTPRSAQPRSGAAPASVSAPLRGAVRPSSPPHPRPTSPATYTRLPGASAASLPQRPDAKAIGAWAASIIDGAIRTHRRSTDAPPLPHQRIQLIQPQPAARTAYTSTPSLRPEPLASTAAVSIPLAAARAHSAVFEVLPWSDVTAAVAAPSLRRTAPPADGNSSVNMEAEAPLTAAALRLEQRVDERTAEEFLRAAKAGHGVPSAEADRA